MNILDLKKGESFVVSRVALRGQIGRRLSDMGFVQGARGTLIRKALLGDPIQVKICHYDVSLRRLEAGGIEVEPASSSPGKD
ncbi:MAG: ferrous iron transport protein A [Elusimicrobia bacterium]|nr:ferrous iron transport protein A [Elusimicrobiota bacterium]